MLCEIEPWPINLTKASKLHKQHKSLKALGTFGNNCQRPVFAFDVSQHMRTIFDSKFWLNWSLKLQENIKRNNATVALIKASSLKNFSNSSILVRYHLSQIYLSPEGVVSHNVLYYQHLSISCYAIHLFFSNNRKGPVLLSPWVGKDLRPSTPLPLACLEYYGCQLLSVYSHST